MLEPIETLELYPVIDAKLIELLESLTDDEWQLPTVCSQWTVKDIAAHLLDGAYLRRLSIYRDGDFGAKPENIDSYGSLVNYLNGLNGEWVAAYRRISPRIIIEQIRTASSEVYEFFKTLDPHGEAIFPVAWAGEVHSANWFDIARDYTERWHHQQQIRLAVGKFGIETCELYYPVLDTFMRALPHTYSNIDAPKNTLLEVEITGEAGGKWFLSRQNEKWTLSKSAEKESDAKAVIPQEIAWRLFTKGIDKESAKKQIQFMGDKILAAEVVNMLSVMA